MIKKDNFFLFVLLFDFFRVNYVVLYNHKEMIKLKTHNMNLKSGFKMSELKNALSLVNAYSSLVELDYKYMPLLKKSIRETIDLLDNSFNKEFDIIDINFLLENVTNYFRPILLNSGINLILKKDREEVFISGDYIKLRNVLFNLIINSKESVSNSVNPTIIISSELSDNKVIITCYDNGKGINIDKLSDYTYNKKYGISKSKRIINSHGGIMLYESALNSYTKVYIKLDQIDLV